MTQPDDERAWKCITCDGNPPGAFGFSGWAPEIQHKKIVDLIASIRKETVEECANFVKEACVQIKPENYPDLIPNLQLASMRSLRDEIAKAIRAKLEAENGG